MTEDDFTWKLPTTTKNSLTSKHEGEEECCRLLKYVGGVDLSFLKEDSSMACGTLVVLDLQTLEAVYEDSSVVRLSVPYVPGFLAFREVHFFKPIYCSFVYSTANSCDNSQLNKENGSNQKG